MREVGLLQDQLQLMAEILAMRNEPQRWTLLFPGIKPGAPEYIKRMHDEAIAWARKTYSLKTDPLIRAWVESLSPEQRIGYVQLFNRTQLGDLPLEWLVFDKRFMDYLQADQFAINRQSERWRLMNERIKTIQDFHIGQFEEWYTELEDLAVAVLTAGQREEYRRLFGRFFLVANLTLNELRRLPEIARVNE